MILHIFARQSLWEVSSRIFSFCLHLLPFAESRSLSNSLWLPPSLKNLQMQQYHLCFVYAKTTHKTVLTSGIEDSNILNMDKLQAYVYLFQERKRTYWNRKRLCIHFVGIVSITLSEDEKVYQGFTLLSYFTILPCSIFSN